ncbi:MAG TPA: hypothetical protein VIU14_00815 [Mesorhizobium sp.]
MRIAYFCFITAAVAATAGMSLGIHMGINDDFTLAPAHAHLNLLGWVTMSLYGLYYRSAPATYLPLAWFQVGTAALGFPAMAGGLGVYLATGSHDYRLFIIVGSLLTIGAMMIFLVVLVLHAVSMAGISNRIPAGVAA